MRAVVGLSILLVAAPAAAQVVTFDEAIALSAHTPQVVGPRRALNAREAGDQEIAGTTQAFTAVGQTGVRIFREQERGFEGQITATQNWYLADLTGARRRTAATEREVIAAQARAAALTARLDAARRWIDLWQVARSERVLREESELAVRARELMSRAVQAGVRTRLDEDEVNAYLAEVTLRAIALEGTRHEASLALATAMGRAPSHELEPTGGLPEPMLPPDPERVLATLEHLPSVAIQRLGAAALRTYAVELAAESAGQISVGGYLQQESPTGFIVEGVLGIALPTFDHGERARSQAIGEAALLEGQADQARLEAERELSLAIHDVEHQRSQERATNEMLVPALVALVSHREAALRAGEGTVFELFDARRRLLDARSRAVEARSRRAWAEVRLWLFLTELQRAQAAP